MGLLDKFKRTSDKVMMKQQKDNKAAISSVPTTDKTLEELNETKTVNQKAKTEAQSAVKSVKKVSKDDTKRAYRVLVKPLITEKGTYLASENKYIFEVAKDANKIEIKKAIEAVYNVSPIKVNIISVKGRKVRHGKVSGMTKDRKKAVVTLKSGESINVYEGV